MKLFEITNGMIGESYVRCYVWAKSCSDALEAAKLEMGSERKLQCLLLFEDTAPGFCTKKSDSGWE